MTSHARKMLVSAAMVAMTPTVCLAQAEPVPGLITDRPDFTESSEVVGHLVVQLESGTTFERTHTALHQITLPQMLLRVGVGSRVELRLGADGLVSQSLGPSGQRARSTGRSDVEIGAKIKFLDATRGGLDMAVLPFLSLPTASDGFGTTAYDPGVTLAAARELPRGFGLSGNFNLASITEETGRTMAYEASVSVGHDLGGGFGAYGETYGTLTDGGCACTVNGGITAAAGPNGQFDLAVGRGVSGDAPDWFVGFGFTVRRLRH